MTNQEKEKILELREQGYGYKKISAAVGVSLDSVKSFLRRNKKSEPATIAPGLFCKECEAPLIQIEKRKNKIFCSDKCRVAWWSKHRTEVSKTTMVEQKCECCGKSFLDYPRQKRKYCSYSCYIKKRFGEQL